MNQIEIMKHVFKWARRCSVSGPVEGEIKLTTGHVFKASLNIPLIKEIEKIRINRFIKGEAKRI